jgi:hypothetical protein
MSPATRPSPRDEPAGNPAIAVFAFRRLDLLQLTLDSLGNNEGFQHFVTHVFSDAARSHTGEEGDAVAAVRSFLRDWCADHGAILHEAPTHLGLRSSILAGVADVLRTHESIIVVEDDLLLSRHFLTFMNQALVGCRDREDVMQVSGYFVPHKSTLPEVGLLRAPASWGWGTWRRAWAHYVDDAEALVTQVAPRKTAFDFGGSYSYFDALERNAQGTLDTWAVRWYASMFVRGGYAVYPSRSFVRNIGYRLDATNTGPSRTAGAFLRQPIAGDMPDIDWRSLGKGETREYAETLTAFYRWQQTEWARPTWRERIKARWERLTGDDAGPR